MGNGAKLRVLSPLSLVYLCLLTHKYGRRLLGWFGRPRKRKSGAVPYKLVIERDVPVKMRDGVVLMTDIYRPDSHPGKKFPALLSRTPYNKGPTQTPEFPIMYSPFYYLNPIRAASNGFIVIIQDVRGRWLSEGEFYPFLTEAKDGYDTVEWVRKLPYCNGKVGMYGGSYVGITQWLAATKKHPSLLAISPIQTGSQCYDGWMYDGGVFRLLSMFGWALDLSLDTLTRLSKGAQRRARKALNEGFARYAERKFVRPLPSKEDSLRHTARYFYDWIKHPVQDDYWERWNIERFHASISCATLNIGGWYDPFLRSTIKNFINMRKIHGDDDHRLVIGPWSHFPPYVVKVGDADFGPEAYIDLDDLQLGFFEKHLKEKSLSLGRARPKKNKDRRNSRREPPVMIFVMGKNKWREENDWPLARAQSTKYYLHSSFSLSEAPPGRISEWGEERERGRRQQYDAYTFDPNNPLPSLGGPNWNPDIQGPRDQRPLYTRDDVLLYKTPILKEDVEVTGPVRIELWISSSASDTDFASRLVDIFSDGYSRDLTSGILRASYRSSLKRREPLKPNKPYLLQIDMGATSNLFKRGHKIGVQISSSDFPAYDVNPNSGTRQGLGFSFDDMRPALQKIYRDPAHPSNLILPIVKGALGNESKKGNR